jgi:hypothetical protein
MTHLSGCFGFSQISHGTRISKWVPSFFWQMGAFQFHLLELDSNTSMILQLQIIKPEWDSTQITANRIYYIPGSSWSWKFPHQNQNRLILLEKELLNGYFHSRTFFKFQPERFRTVVTVCLTLLKRFFPFQNVRSVPNGKNHSGVLFSTPTPKIVFLGFGI